MQQQACQCSYNTTFTQNRIILQSICNKNFAHRNQNETMKNRKTYGKGIMLSDENADFCRKPKENAENVIPLTF